jgi:hypothetical protein
MDQLIYLLARNSKQFSLKIEISLQNVFFGVLDFMAPT